MSRFKEFLNEMTVGEDKQINVILEELDKHIYKFANSEKVSITNMRFGNDGGLLFDAKLNKDPNARLFTFELAMVKKH